MLEVDASCELELARLVGLGRDLTIGRKRSDRGARPRELNTVEQVERFNAKHESHSLRDVRLLEQSQIPVGDARETKRIVGAGFVAKREAGRRDKACQV